MNKNLLSAPDDPQSCAISCYSHVIFPLEVPCLQQAGFWVGPLACARRAYPYPRARVVFPVA